MAEEPSTKKLCLESNGAPVEVAVEEVKENSKDVKSEEDIDVQIIKVEESSVKEQEDADAREIIIRRQPEDVGMTEFVGQHRGFSGTMKNRWEDFHVHEITMSGDIVRLTTTELPPEGRPKVEVDESVITDEIKENLTLVIDGKMDVYKLPAPEEKEERTKLHVTIKKSYPQLCSNTISEGDKRMIEIKLKKNSKERRRDEPRRTCQFVLHKKGQDTGQAIDALSGLLRSHTKKFAYAGNKDKRAISSQLVTAYQVSMDRLQGLNSILRGIKVGNFKYVKKSLELGDLKGNHFTIAIRDVEGDETDIAKSMQSLMENGFINYFGLQRFGSGATPSYDIGLAIIGSQWEKAIDLILEPQLSDLPKNRALKRKYKEDRDADTALKGMSDHVSRKLLYGISKHGRTVDALMEMPRQLRQLYIHSTQSLLWNRLVSRRVREFGLKVHPGDLIVKEECRGIRVKRPNAIMQVTEENMAGISIYDLVVPLPGFDVTFGTGKIRQWYLELLLELDLTEEKFKHEIKDFSAAGTYRNIFVRPSDLSFHSRYYDDPLESVIPSDWELLTSPDKTAGPPPLTSAGKHKAVVVNFSLPKSSYATVAIHELMRTVTIKK